MSTRSPLQKSNALDARTISKNY